MSKEQPAQNVFRRYPTAMACAAVALVLLGGVCIRFSALGEARAELEQNETEDQKTERNLVNSVSLEQHVEEVEHEVSRIESMLIGIDDVSGNQGYFYRMESSTGVRVSVLRPSGPAKDTPKGAAYQPAGFNVVVQGRLPHVVAFLRAMENGERLYRLVDFSLQRASDQSAVGPGHAEVALNLNLQLLARK